MNTIERDVPVSGGIPLCVRATQRAGAPGVTLLHSLAALRGTRPWRLVVSTRAGARALLLSNAPCRTPRPSP